MCKSESTTKSDKSQRSDEYKSFLLLLIVVAVLLLWIMTTSNASNEVCLKVLEDIFKNPAMAWIDSERIPDKSRLFD